MKKYIVYEGMNSFISTSRNARKHIIDGGYDDVTVTTLSGEFVCRGRRWWDGTITVTTQSDEG